MFGVDLDQVAAPFTEKMGQIVDRLDTVITLLEEVSKKLDNLPG